MLTGVGGGAATTRCRFDASICPDWCSCRSCTAAEALGVLVTSVAITLPVPSPSESTSSRRRVCFHVTFSLVLQHERARAACAREALALREVQGRHQRLDHLGAPEREHVFYLLAAATASRRLNVVDVDGGLACPVEVRA